jgi:hypothetical protein
MNEILLFSYWEHVKAEKDLAKIFAPTHKKRIELNSAANEMLEKLHEDHKVQVSDTTKAD